MPKVLRTFVLVSSLTVGVGHGAVAAETISIEGSSTVYPISQAVAEEFQSEAGGDYQVLLRASGTGPGFEKFCRGEIDVANASRPISAAELSACKRVGIEFIEIPIAFDAVSVVVHPQNDWVDWLSVEELKRIWEPAAYGKVTSWNQVRPGFPERPLNLYGPGAGSGTYDYFTEAIVGKEHESRIDFRANEDDNLLVQAVAGDPDALGFFGLAYYAQNQDRLKLVAIRNGDQEPVAPSIASAKDGSYQPLSRPLFIYVSKRAADASKALQGFIEFYLNPEVIVDLVSEVGYVPLPAEVYELASANFAERKSGTAFGEGAIVGISIHDLLTAKNLK